MPGVWTIHLGGNKVVQEHSFHRRAYGSIFPIHRERGW